MPKPGLILSTASCMVNISKYFYVGKGRSIKIRQKFSSSSETKIIASNSIINHQEILKSFETFANLVKKKQANYYDKIKVSETL